MPASLRTVRGFFSDKRVIVALVFCFVAAAIALYVLDTRSSSQFAKQYAAYVILAKQQEAAAYLPAAPNNPTRQQLDLALSQALDSKTSPSDRLQDARQGLVLVAQLEKEADAIGDTSDKANIVIAQMQVSSANDFSAAGLPEELISLAKQRSSTIEDIRGLTYRADFETTQIFQRIIDGNGTLTPAYINSLNDEIPQVETEFDQRTNLYTQLTSLSAEMDQKAAAGLGAGYSSTPVATTTGE